MDRRLRQLEKLAAQGDPEAQEKLANEWGRLKLVPTQDDCIEMQKCGFVEGIGPVAMQEGMRIWCRLLRKLADTAYDHRRSALIYADDDVDETEFRLAREIREETGTDITQAETETNLVIISGLMEDSIYPYINVVLEFEYENPRAPLYQHLSAFDTALHLAYMDHSPHNFMGAFNKIYLIFREVKNQMMTSIEWNWQGVSLNIPNIFRYQPRVWNHWGWGQCNNRSMHLGNWDYDPLVNSLGSRHYLV